MAPPTDPKSGDKAAPSADKPSEQQKQNSNNATLEEDDEFEDFPVDDWPAEETDAAAAAAGAAPGASGEANQHLWEESWDDDDTSDDFSQQLRDELKKVEASKRR